MKADELYSAHRRGRVWFSIGLAAALAVAVLISLSLGAVRMGPGRIWAALTGGGDEIERAILLEMRAPRVGMAVFGGACLGLAGAAVQGGLRNPLASPFTLGIASASGFGAALAITLGVGLVGWGRYLVVANAFAFALLASALSYGIARLKGASTHSLILAGVAVMYLFSSLTSILQYVGRREDVHAVVFWMLGSLNGMRWREVCAPLGALLISAPVLTAKSWEMNAMLAGDEVAMSLGVNVRRLKLMCAMLSALMTASVICFTGTIGFIGLVAPHMARMAIGAEHSLLFPCSALTGALLLLGADTVSRLLIAPSEIPIGITTSLIGIPFFLYLLMRRGR